MPPRRAAARRSARRSIVARLSPSTAAQFLRNADPNLGTPTPDADDYDMQEAQVSDAASPAPQETIEPELIPDNDDEQDEDVAGTPPADETDGTASKAGSPEPARSRGRGRGRGRRGRPRVRAMGERRSSKEGSQEASDTGTPKRRGGWRGGRGFGAGRWANRRGGAQRADQMPQDAQGNPLGVENDEADIPGDPAGEKKVDRNGNLLGGRQYRVRVFTVLGRESRQYMLSTEPARCIGFRDSYLFFQKHRVLYKIILNDEEKLDLIRRDLMPHSYKGRSIGVVTARSVFREFGAKIVIGGRNVTDDYYEDLVRATGAVEGELTVPDDIMPGPGEEYDRNRYVAWHGASAVYHTAGPTIPLQAGKPGEIKKRKVPLTSVNWMLEHAREASRFNSILSANRRANLDGVYDVHTNLLHYPKIMQPTHASWERLPSPPPEQPREKALTNGTTNGDVVMSDHDSSQLIMPTPDPFVTRNFMVVDHVYVTPPMSNLGIPGVDGATWDIGTPGLVDIPQEAIDSLTPEERSDFLAARGREAQWKGMWNDEAQDGRRPGKNGLKPVKISYSNWTAALDQP